MFPSLETRNSLPGPLCRKTRESQQTEGGSGAELPELTCGLKTLNRFSPSSQTGLVSDEKSSAQTLRNWIIVVPGSLGAWLPSCQLRGVLWRPPRPACSFLSCRGQHGPFLWRTLGPLATRTSNRQGLRASKTDDCQPQPCPPHIHSFTPNSHAENLESHLPVQVPCQPEPLWSLAGLQLPCARGLSREAATLLPSLFC